ncbi:MAG TPA: hypothetical protein PKM63_06445 [Panacibacter sp.]|nr:hypothetical protein [Panacibacter sp.]HNP43906.1 hypothetical protein [Panacibacter sp.]
MRSFTLLLLLILISVTACFAQEKKSKDSIKIFKDDEALNVKIVTDIKKLLASKRKPAYQEAQWVGKLPDSTEINETIRLRARGVFRRETCYIPNVKLNFHNPTSEKLYSLNELKLVSPCENGDAADQLLLKEYLIYKMYNLLTKKSFKVRLLNLTFEDSKGNKKPIVQHGFLLENVERMADRNKCNEYTKPTRQENTDRGQMTLVTLFQYMIGNTDWECNNFHNIKLITPKDEPTQKPYAVPYDFDFAGLVNAPYASPNPLAGTTQVTERWYMGYARTLEELQTTITIFTDQKQKILDLVNNCDLLTKLNKKDMISYLNDFFDRIEDEGFVRRTFINYARY